MTSLVGADVLLVSRPGDEHGDALEAAFETLNVKVVRLSLETVSRLSLSWQLEAEELRIGPNVFRTTTRGFWRRPGHLVASGIDEAYRDFAATEWREAFMTAALTSIDWLTSPHVLVRAENKGYQLMVARALGYDVPRTLLTSDITEAKRFQRKLGSRIVVKPVRYGLVSKEPALIAFTTEVNLDDIDDLGGVPIVLQELVAAAVHLRVVTVGARAFVSQLETMDLDWRATRENHSRFTRVGIDDLDVGSAAVRVATALGIGYSSQDWIRTASNRLVFLEANPNGQWLFLDAAHGGAITRTLALAIFGSGRC